MKTVQALNTMPYHQSANGVGYDALKVSELIGKPLPENKAATLEQTIEELSASVSFNEQYHQALLKGDVKKAGQALKDFYLSTQIAQTVAEHPLTEQTRKEMDEVDARNQRAFILQNLEALREIFNENGARFSKLWEQFKPTRLSAKEIEGNTKLQKLVPELVSVAETLYIIRRIAQDYHKTGQKYTLAHRFMTGCAFPATYSEHITGVVPQQLGTAFSDQYAAPQQRLNTAGVFATMLEREPRAGETITLHWNTEEQLQEQEEEYEHLIEELEARTRSSLLFHPTVSLTGKEIEVFKYWLAHKK